MPRKRVQTTHFVELKSSEPTVIGDLPVGIEILTISAMKQEFKTYLEAVLDDPLYPVQATAGISSFLVPVKALDIVYRFCHPSKFHPMKSEVYKSLKR
jgi:hypothetical protein